jgi:transcriptional regulator with XRE-family HTH domain
MYRLRMVDVAKIKKLREGLKLTQQQAAEAAGFGSKQNWNNIETGRRENISVKVLGDIARVLKCKARDLLK